MAVGGSDEDARFAKVLAAYQFVLAVEKWPAVWKDKTGKVWVKVHAIAARDASLVPEGQKLLDLICFVKERPEVEQYEHTQIKRSYKLSRCLATHSIVLSSKAPVCLAACAVFGIQRT